MNVDVLRFADRHLGGLLCRLLTVMRHLLRPFVRAANHHLPQRILIIKLAEMGSTVLAYPAVAQLKRRLPHAEIHVLTFWENRAVFDALDLTPVARTVAVDTSSAWRFVRSGLGAIAHLRRHHIDTTIDMDFFSRFTAALAFLICPRGRRVGFDRFTSEGLGRGNLLTHPVVYSPHVHTAEAFMALVEGLFSPHPAEIRLKQFLGGHDYAPPVHRPLPETLAAVRETLAAAALDPAATGGRLVLVNPNSSALLPQRRWPVLQFIELCRRLLDARPDLHIAITGSRAEQDEARQFVLQVGSPRCASLAGLTSFTGLLALYTLADLLITNDSGPAHFAALTPLPVVVLFGPETPRLYAPLGARARCLYAHYACSPCVSVYNAKKSPCGNNRCLQAISVDDVLHEALAALPPPAP